MSNKGSFKVAGSFVKGEFEVSGSFNRKAGAPIILKTCEHLVENYGHGKILDRDEIWKIITHGDSNGFSKVKRHCEKLVKDNGNN